MTPSPTHSPASATGIRRLWDRQLPAYPETVARYSYLAVTVVVTIALYYQLYIQGAVATRIITDFGFSFTQFVFVSVLGYAVGAFAALFAGLADRWGRANLVVGGLLVVAALVTFGLPSAESKAAYAALFALVSIVEGVVLVVTPALIRDFSPQLGRASAMGFWTLGPVLGSLVVTIVSSHTLDSHSDWQFQFRLAGIIGFAAFALAAVALRELSPRLRDQLMISMRDRALVEARAMGLDEEKALSGHWRQMLRVDILVSGLAISTFLLFYSVIVGFLVVYMATIFGYTPARANSLGNWYWGCTAIVLVLTGFISDKLRVRKPFMIIGAVLALIGTVIFATRATRPDTSYSTFVVCLVLAGVGLGMAYVAWMASYTETVERRNPAATATGLAVWGWIQRLTITAALAVLTVVVPATSTLADKGPRLSQIAATYPNQIAVLQAVDSKTLAQLQANPNDPEAQVRALSTLSGLTPTDTARTLTLSTKYTNEIKTAAAIAPNTLQSLSANPIDRTAQQAAITEIARSLRVTISAAGRRLSALAVVPPGDLSLLRANGPKLTQAAGRLRSVSQVPAADLAYLAANGAAVTRAQKDNPTQWQHWWWICIAGELLFVPAVFVMSGRWSPRRAREDAQRHEAQVTAELLALERGSGTSVAGSEPAAAGGR